MIESAKYQLAVAYLTQCEAVHDAFVIMSSGHRKQLEVDFPTLFDALTRATVFRAQFDNVNVPSSAAPSTNP